MGRIIQLSQETLSEIVDIAVQALRQGEIVAVPSDTLYGVTTTLDYAHKLYDLKKRSTLKPLGLFLSKAEEAKNWAHVTVSDRTMERLLPGPVTLMFLRKPSLPIHFNPETEKVGIRVPDSPVIAAICSRLRAPLAQTSANVSGSPLNPIRVDDFSDLHSNIDVIIDGGCLRSSGDSSHAEGSTIVDLSRPGFYEILRDGCARQATVDILHDCQLYPFIP